MNLCKPPLCCAAVLLLAVAFLPAAASEIRITAERTMILADAEPRLEYRYAGADLFKPYVAGLYLPGSVNPLRDAPHDHLHHHALMFAWNVDNTEFWAETPESGRQLHDAFADAVIDGNTGPAGFAERLSWVAPAAQGARDTLLLEERRLLLLRGGSDGPTLLDWSSRFSLPPGKVAARIGGREYHGLGVRFVASMDSDGQFLSSEGGQSVEETNGRRARWCSYSAKLESGAPVTLAIFDHPRNPRSPADWFTMNSPFAYMTATLGVDAEPLMLEPGQRLELRYGVALFAGKAPAEAIEAAYRGWLER